MTDVLYDKLVYGRELTREQWRKIKYRPFSDSDMYAIIEDPSFGIDKSEIGPVIPTDRILYTVVEGGHKPESTWITERCSENVFDENTGEGYLVLNEDVTELIEYWDEEIGKDCTIFADIDWDVVEGETNILSITIPTQITSIGENCFNFYYNLESVIIPDSVMSIDEYAFGDCIGLTSITIPDSVINIGESAFYGCSNLASIVVNTGNRIYDSRNNCNAIIETATNTLVAGCKNTIIPDSVTSIGDGVFVSCTSLTAITIPDSVTSIGDDAFYVCTSLTSITIPDSVTSIGDRAFYGCTSLTAITIPDSVTSIGDGVFVSCTSLTSITISNSVTSINEWTFAGCRELTSIIIPDSVISISDRAFDGCTGLTTVTIGNSVTTINGTAFCDCPNLTLVTCLVINPPVLGRGNFTAPGDTLYVPADSVQAYLDNTAWNTAFNGNIQAIAQ